MAVVLRLSRHGQKNRPFYRLVATEKTSRRDGKFIEILGTVNTMADPVQYSFKEEKVRKWIEQGAKASGLVRNLIIKSIPGLIEDREKHQRAKIQATRKKRKERATSARK